MWVAQLVLESLDWLQLGLVQSWLDLWVVDLLEDQWVSQHNPRVDWFAKTSA